MLLCKRSLKEKSKRKGYNTTQIIEPEEIESLGWMKFFVCDEDRAQEGGTRRAREI